MEAALDMDDRLDVVTVSFDDDEVPPASSSGRPVTIKEPTYSRDDVAMTADELTVVLELNATSSSVVREGLDLVVVLDMSVSMHGEKLASMKKAMQFVIMKLTPVDRLSIVVMSKQVAARYCPLRSVTRRAQAELVALLDQLVLGGRGNIEHGILNAIAVITERTITRARTANVFVMSDGGFHGETNNSLTPTVAIYTFGFGKDADNLRLSDLASKSPGGKFSSVPDGQNVTEPFSRLLGCLLTVVAQDVQLTLTPSTQDGDLDAMSVEPGTDYTQITDGDTGVITVMLGTLSSGETRQVAVKLTLNSSDQIEAYHTTLASARSSYTAQGDVHNEPTDGIRIRIHRTTNPAALRRMVQTGSKLPLALRYDEQILATGSKPPIPLQYLKEITNNFSDERILGKGGFGVVYKGVLQNGEMVAVKKLLHAMPSSQKQFENEVNLLMKLEHQNVVRLVGYCYETKHLHTPHEGKSVFAWNTESLLCLECLPNGSLDKYISDASSGLDWHTRCQIIEGISYGLEYLHDHSNEPIIHLDLKPANILLDVNMRPKITDFGLSRLFDQTQTVHTAFTSGTLGYMPPEFLRGIFTPMSDIFSLGVIIMEIITGHRDYPYDIRKSSEEFIKCELQKWRNRLHTDTSLETDCQQIERCIQIGLVCVNPQRTKRPKMKNIIDMLQGLENMNRYICNELSSHNIQEVP